MPKAKKVQFPRTLFVGYRDNCVAAGHTECIVTSVSLEGLHAHPNEAIAIYRLDKTGTLFQPGPELIIDPK